MDGQIYMYLGITMTLFCEPWIWSERHSPPDTRVSDRPECGLCEFPTNSTAAAAWAIRSPLPVRIPLRKDHHTMAKLALLVLNIVHFFYAVYNAVCAFFQRFGSYPLPLSAPRQRIPSHLALLLTCDEDADDELAEEIFTHTVYNAVRWCRLVGIKRLSVYDTRGTYAKHVTMDNHSFLVC